MPEYTFRAIAEGVWPESEILEGHEVAVAARREAQEVLREHGYSQRATRARSQDVWRRKMSILSGLDKNISFEVYDRPPLYTPLVSTAPHKAAVCAVVEHTLQSFDFYSDRLVPAKDTPEAAKEEFSKTVAEKRAWIEREAERGLPSPEMLALEEWSLLSPEIGDGLTVYVQGQDFGALIQEEIDTAVEARRLRRAAKQAEIA